MSSYTFQDKQQQQLQPPQDFAEDKKCRICGYADIGNINIYSPRNCKHLVAKILAVYPIVMYENDPLPKNICKKCLSNVSLMYNDILRVMKIQIKWINNVRTSQPQHKYIRVMDQIENANNVTRDSIKATLGEDINEMSVSRLLFANYLEDQSKEPQIVKVKFDTAEAKPPAKRHTLMSFSMDYDDGVTSKVSRPTTKETDTISKPKLKQMKDIKSLLEQNGCSLVHLKNSKTTTNKIATNSSLKSDCTEDPQLVKVKEESIEDITDNDNQLQSVLSTDATVSTKLPGPPPPLTVKCRLCPLQFNSLALLATHQIIHMRLCVPKIFQKKYLHKRVRRGRLISVQERKCIRCLNCWRVFVDNKSILEHWAMGECDFYCHICGKEFAQAPKMLREHVPAAHGISYRSSKFHRARLSTKIIMSMAQAPEENPDFKLYQAVSEQEPLPFEELGASMELTKTKTIQKRPPSIAIKHPSKSMKSTKSSASKKTSSGIYNEDGTISCHICLKSFQNFKARNSHMRKHKPVYAYGDVVLPPIKGVSVNVKEEICKNTDARVGSSTIVSNASKTQNPNYSLSSSQAIILPTQATTLPTTSNVNVNSTPLRGVRTKFVALRNDPNGANSEAASGSITMLKVKPLNELQNPDASIAVAASSSWQSSACSAPQDIAAPALEIKSEPIDFETDFPHTSTHCTAQQEKTFTCIPCSDQFATKLELFRHKRKCRANYLITCEYCSESFRCSADYQLHVAQVHSYSNTN